MNISLVSSEKWLERLRMLTEVSRALTYATSIDEVLGLAVKRAAELVGAGKSLVMLTDEDGLLVVRAAHGVEDARVQEFREPLNETLVSRLQGLLDYQSAESFLSVPLVVQGEVTGLLAVVRPGTEPASEDDEWLLSALADQTAVALDNARLTDAVLREQAERGRIAEAQGRVQATLSHELRSPLTAIQAYSSLLLEGVLDPLTDRQREAIARIRMSGEHLLAVIENVLDVARLGAGTILLERKEVPVGEVMVDALRMLQPMAAEKEQELRSSIATDPTVHGDPHRLRQALVNLVSNAIKYTPRHGTIDVRVTTGEWRGAACAAIAVADTGRGIPPEGLATLFKPYDRGATPTLESGLGLGLFISRELVRQMGGDIEVESQLEVGSTFTVFVPLAAGPD